MLDIKNIFEATTVIIKFSHGHGSYENGIESTNT
jgi:hypothetical protein